MLLRILPASILVGLAAGASSAAFLAALEIVSLYRVENPWTLWLLPAAGYLIGSGFKHFGGSAAGGNRRTMTEIAQLEDGVPLRMAPMVLVGTLVTHLFGGSAGREGTALQMSAGLTDGIARRARLSASTRRHLLVVALAGGFGSVFGVPWAGVVFAFEVAPATLRVRLSSVPAAFVASFLGNRVVGWLGVSHQHYPRIDSVDLSDVAKVTCAGVVFGLAAWAFIRLTEGVKEVLARAVTNSALRPVVGGVAVIALTLAVGTRAYNGLSLPLLDLAFTPGGVIATAFAIKILMTALTVGSGFHGGEVTPLFVVGATLGSALATPFGASTTLFAGVGMMAVFGAAANASLACVVMGIELFGWGAAVPLATGCLVARAFSSKRHLYEVIEPV